MAVGVTSPRTRPADRVAGIVHRGCQPVFRAQAHWSSASAPDGCSLDRWSALCRRGRTERSRSGCRSGLRPFSHRRIRGDDAGRDRPLRRDGSPRDLARVRAASRAAYRLPPPRGSPGVRRDQCCGICRGRPRWTGGRGYSLEPERGRCLLLLYFIWKLDVRLRPA